MKTVTIDKLSNYEGKDVELKGWVYNTRNVGKIWFVIFRDGTGPVSYTHLTLPTNREV